jgi:DNA-binding CsgD family transcriptional regulator
MRICSNGENIRRNRTIHGNAIPHSPDGILQIQSNGLLKQKNVLTKLHCQGILPTKTKPMTEQEITYHNLIKQVKHMTESACWCDHSDEPMKDITQLDNLVCLKNQFYILAQFPNFRLTYVSKGIKDILDIDNSHLSMKALFACIHPEDAPIVMLATKKMTELIQEHYAKIIPYESVFTMDYRLRRSDGTYMRFLNQNSLICKKDCCHKFLSLSVYTDISHIKTSRKIEFDYTERDQHLGIEFPDEELRNFSNCFTHREREILSLLAIGKNSCEIGEKLNISRHTVDTHRRKMLSKCHLCNTAELVAYSLENNMVPHPQYQ